MLNNGMGGVDWTGFPLAVMLFGIEDIEDTIMRVLVIKGHRPPDKDDAPPPIE